jgi:nucleoside-diphosphate-sugar epimerase
VRGDLEDKAALRQAAKDQDVIYHAAGLVAARDEAGFLAVNRDGTARVLAAAAEVSHARFVLVSSLAAGGPVERGTRRSGDEPAQPVTAYGRSKLAGEVIVRGGSLDWVIARPPAVYGPGDREFLRVFKATRVGIVPVFGDGAQQLSLVYAPDLAEALVALGHSTATQRVFYPCHPEVLTSSGLAHAVGRVMDRTIRTVGLPAWTAQAALSVTSTAARLRGRTTLLTRDKAHEFFAPAWTADPAPLQAATGWHAAHDAASGLAATAAWYRAAGWL